MPTNLQPVSTVSAVVLPSTGTHADVVTSLAYGIYNTSEFVSGAVDQVAYTYQKLGGNVLDLEITPSNVYNGYEESCLEYSYLINTHQAKNVLADLLGNSSGTFDQDGEFVNYDPGTDVKPNLKFPRFQLGYATHMARGVSLHVGIGSTQQIYSASFDSVRLQQDYDIQTLLYEQSLTASCPFYNKIGNSAVTIDKVYYKSPNVSWFFFGGFPIGTVGNLSTYGMYADDSTWQLVPAWQNVLQAYQFKEDLNVRASHYSFAINDNRLRLFPVPNGSPERFWLKFRVSEEAFDEESDRRYGASGVNNMNTLPFPNVPYANINSIGKQWIRRFSLALSKETLGQVRSKLATIPIPGNDVTLNGSTLVSDAKQEQSDLRDELKTVLDELVYGKLTEGDQQLQGNLTDVLAKIPKGIYVG